MERYCGTTTWYQLLCAVVIACMLVSEGVADAPTAGAQPQQVHIALGEAPGSMSVTWVTMSVTPNSTVEYGQDISKSTPVEGTMTQFVDGGQAKRTMYMHRALLIGLKPQQMYMYHVGSDLGWSDVFYFKLPRTDPNWSPRLAIFGDFGNANAQSLARLQQEVQRNTIDAVLHVGDFAYDMATDDAQVGDAFMRQIESVAAYVPYMTSVGNHENHYNFSNYRARFTMPKANGDGEGLWYSFDFGMAHFVSFSSEVFFYTKELVQKQMTWLKADLMKANQNRANRPWIITLAHRPAYCSNTDKDDCTKINSVVRLATEDLFYKTGVDLSFWAHEHSYERVWPIYNYTVCNGTRSPYDNPPAPVHIITGSAGCRERHDPFGPTAPYFTAYRTQDYGYSHMTIHNATHISLNQISDDKGGAIVDKIVLIKDHHSAGMFTCHEKKDAYQEQLRDQLQKYRQKVAASRK